MPCLLVVIACLFGLIDRASAQARECPTGSLAPGAAVSGALEAADCRFNELIAGGASTSFAKRYRLDVTEKAVYAFALTAADYPAAVGLYTAQGRLVGSGAAAAAGGVARVAANLPAGAYTAISYSTRAAAVGAFELKVEQQGIRPCPILDLPESGAIEGAFTSSSCRFVDLSELSVNTNNVVFYRYSMAKRGVLSLAADSAIARFSTVLVTSALAGFTGAKQLTLSLPAGAHSVSVSSAETGSFTLRIKTEDLRPCGVTVIRVGEDAAGKLDAAGCRWLDQFVPSADATPVSLYRFTLDSRAVVQIDQTSAEVNSYLALFRTVPSFAQLAFNDNAAANTGDSRILIHLLPGVYTLIATASFNEAAAGAFALALAANPPKTCEPTPLGSGVTVDGQVQAEGCRVLDYVVNSTVADVVAPFAVDAPRPIMLSLKAENAFGSTLRLVTGQGVEVARLANDRNGGMATESRTVAGVHTVLMTSPTVSKPVFKLGAKTRELSICPVNELALNAEAGNAITALECRVTDLVNYFTFNNPAQLFEFKIAERGVITLEMESDVFPPVLIVTDALGELVGLTFIDAPGKAVLPDGALPVGTYRIVASSLATTLGAFNVRTIFVPAAPPPATASVPDWRRLHEAAADGGLPVNPIHLGIGAPDVVGVGEGWVYRNAAAGDMRHGPGELAGRDHSMRPAGGKQ